MIQLGVHDLLRELKSEHDSSKKSHNKILVDVIRRKGAFPKEFEVS